jgi:hypothetical protein
LLATQERAVSAVDNHALSEILALALKLQAREDETLSEAQVLEMGRELGIRPEFVYEALRLKGRASSPATTETAVHHRRLVVDGDGAIATVTRTLISLFALGMLPGAWELLAQHGAGGVPAFALLVALIAGWSARYPRLARVSGALACPLTLLVASFYSAHHYRGPFYSWPDSQTIFFALLALCPLGSSVASGSARFRRWMERLVDRPLKRVVSRPVAQP